MGKIGPHADTPSCFAGTGGGVTRLDGSELDILANKYFLKGLADSTRRAYGSAQKQYLRFCEREGMAALPGKEGGLHVQLARFVPRLVADKLMHKTIKAYLSGVRYLHIAEGRRDPFEWTMNRLQYTLRGIKRCEAESGDKSRERLPITLGILKRIRDIWSSAGPDPDTSMLWVAYCLDFCG